MTGETRTRKLAAIVAGDVAGFSRLMGADEEATLEALKAHRRDLIDPKITELGGRIVKTTGDGMLIEFASVVDAVRCCVDIQVGMQERNEAVPEEKRIRFRMGVNLGDVIIDGDDIYGNGVNVAARLEAIAAPGGICISETVEKEVRHKLPLEIEDLGERALKNIEEPVHTFRIAGIGQMETDEPTAGKTGEEQQVYHLAETPSLAILPFRNLSGNPSDDFIAEGIGLGIQTVLVQLSGLFFVNATGDRDYIDGKRTASEAVREVPVRYVLEGTVQRGGARVRVTVQLTDTQTDAVVWAERYDRELEDIFELQDSITREVVTALNLEIHGAEYLRIALRELKGGEAWEYFLRGVSHIYKFNKEDNHRAREMFQKLYDLRPDKVQGAGYIALTHWLDSTRGWSDDTEESLSLAADWAEKAIEYNANDGIGHVVLSFARLSQRRYDEALELSEKSLEFRSSCPAALGQAAMVKLYCGDADGAVTHARHAMTVRLINPPMLINLLAEAYRDGGQTDLSVPAARESFRLDGGYTDALATLCTDYMLDGNTDEAERTAAELLSVDPGFSIGTYMRNHPYRDSAVVDKISGLLSQAGLPD